MTENTLCTVSNIPLAYMPLDAARDLQSQLAAARARIAELERSAPDMPDIADDIMYWAAEHIMGNYSKEPEKMAADLRKIADSQPFARLLRAEQERDAAVKRIAELERERDARDDQDHAREDEQSLLDCAARDMVADILAERDAAVKRVGELERERDAYRKAKQENDERFMLERDAARAEVAKLKAQRETMARWLERYAQHEGICYGYRGSVPSCDCGLSAALAAGNDRDETKGEAT